MVRRSDVVLDEILGAIALIEQELAGHTQASFARALFLQRGTERSLEIISEAVRHLPDALLEMRPEIVWGTSARSATGSDTNIGASIRL